MKIFPSILSADFSCLSDDLDPLVREGVNQLHLDVMDGHFVPNISFGMPVINSLVERYPDQNWDAHLMISQPEEYFDEFLSLGMRWISVHVETDPDIKLLRKQSRGKEVQLGLAFNPGTPVSDLTEYLPQVDYVLAMTVQPGFGGQSFREDVLEKIKRLKKEFSGPVQVDGGVGRETLPRAYEAGADWFVSGSSVFGASNPADAVQRLKNTV
ncbi:MAG: ribulose-phosphate 3-epimerase [bacterium]